MASLQILDQTDLAKIGVRMLAYIAWNQRQASQFCCSKSSFAIHKLVSVGVDRMWADPDAAGKFMGPNRIGDSAADQVHQPQGGHWSVFRKPVRFAAIPNHVTAVPGTLPNDLCLFLPPDLWAMFREVSLWVEALCLHDWCRFSEQITNIDRGLVYRLLTDQPDNRRPLDWERNQIDILIMEGQEFCCPWTARLITKPGSYDLDHLIPVSIYPINELWNLVPADRQFNQRIKRDRLPSWQRLVAAENFLAQAYTQYATTPLLAHVLREDVASRFAVTPDPTQIAHVTITYIDQIATLRNLARF